MTNDHLVAVVELEPSRLRIDCSRGWSSPEADTAASICTAWDRHVSAVGAVITG